MQQINRDSQPAKMVCILTLFASIFSAFIVTGDHNDHNVINVANFAMDVHNRMSSYPYAFKVVDILSDAAQLYPPARVKYMLQIKAVQTACENHASVNLTDCALQSNAKICCFFDQLRIQFPGIWPPPHPHQHMHPCQIQFPLSHQLDQL
uniref:Cystatin domain-containing protein n=1 Tax=Cyprinus carpio carpio TaxID=630221 RepID=A0A9J7XIF7_CYPCA